MKHKTFSFLIVSILLVGLFGSISPAFAEDDGPSPITVTSSADSPSGNEVIVVNRYYPWSNSKVKTDGWADANFPQPTLNAIECKSRVYNNLGQFSPVKKSTGDWGGTDCPVTPISIFSGAQKPATYTSYTEAFFEWPDHSDGYAKAQQSHNE